MTAKRQRLKRMERFGNFVFQFCGLQTLAFSLQPLALLPLLRTGGSFFCGLQTLAFSLQPLAFASMAEIFGKFGGADQLRNAVP
jgi:hypothetical protein